ncbi:MAG: hypothetical protein JSS60_01480 [Verrucomicrobia bacterium]|nr:hypothetical protein [Verrucomicrobiota bacterium]
MPKLHIANAFFEWELETQPKVSLSEAFLQHAIFRQLQFLPALYAAADDGILISELPASDYRESLKELKIASPHTFTLSDSNFSSFEQIESWGPSRIIDDFARKNGLAYSMPEWELVRQVNSKRFSFESSPKLPHALLLQNEKEAKHWIDSTEGKKVLKTCYGVSGKGHLVMSGSSLQWERVLAFLKTEWKKQLPVVAEPWVDRVLDFSTQWVIDKEGNVSYIGSTICKNDDRGQYQYNEVGDEKKLFKGNEHHLLAHRQIAEPILAKIAQMGFFGNVGIDAMLYKLPENPDAVLLHPIVEINARKTMGWAAINFQRQHFPTSMIRFSFASGCEGFLPQAVVDKNGKIFPFHRNLRIEIHES